MSSLGGPTFKKIFWVPVAGVRCKWSLDQCLITEMKQMEMTVKCLYFQHYMVLIVKYGF